ncbi:unnamed protein product, partial [Strongylus vulgaris]
MLPLLKNLRCGCIITCPICECAIKSKWSQKHQYTVERVLKHLRRHEGELDKSQNVACSVCYNFCPRSKLHDHYRDFHLGLPEKYINTEVLCFTNSVQRYQDLFNEYTQVRNMDLTANKCSGIPAESKFVGYPTKKSLERCRTMWRQKFDLLSEPKFLLRFKISSNLSKPFTWVCPLCVDSVFLNYCSFSNDISLRLFVLRHLSMKHKYLDSLAAPLSRE